MSENGTADHACCTYSNNALSWPWHSESEWKPSSLIKTVRCSQLSGGHGASLPRWKDATLANNEVSFFFRLCCRHSIMRRLFNRGLCEASALMQHIHPPLHWRKCSHFCVLAVCFFINLLWIQVTVPYIKTKQCWLVSLSRPFTLLSLVSFNMSPLGSLFQCGRPQHRKFISGYAEGHGMLYKHDS